MSVGRLTRCIKSFSVFATKDEDLEDSPQLQESEALPVLFPMYTVPVRELLQMIQVRPHEELQRDGVLTLFDSSMGRAAFVSHQWITPTHPDPEAKQMRVLQHALAKMLREKSTIYPEVIQGMYLTGSSLSTESFRSEPLFVWYDYFSVPQGKDLLENSMSFQDVQKTDQALESIPAYIDRCELFLVLCPLIPSPDRSELFGPSTWASRGWCRTEILVRLLSPNSSAVVIKNSNLYETRQGPFAVTYMSPGQGAFGFSDDKEKIGELLRKVMKRCLRLCLKSEDFVRYRLYLNLQNSVFKGFSHANAISDVDLQASPAESFLHQNLFQKVTDVDAVGYSPLCYAALDGNPDLVGSLLRAAADPNVQTKASNPLLNTGAGISVLALAAWYGNSEAVSVLLAARADIHAGLISPLELAASGNQRELVRLLANAGGRPNAVSAPGASAIMWASLHGFTDSAFELASSGVNLSQSLHFAAIHLGNAELVMQLVDAKADVNEPFRPRGYTKLALRLHKFRRTLRCSAETSSVLQLAQHCWEATPLMIAVISGNDEMAVALISAGARLDLRNWQQKTALDLAQGVPHFLLKMLQGQDDGEMKRMVQAAVCNRYPVSCSF